LAGYKPVTFKSTLLNICMTSAATFIRQISRKHSLFFKDISKLQSTWSIALKKQHFWPSFWNLRCATLKSYINEVGNWLLFLSQTPYKEHMNIKHATKSTWQRLEPALLLRLYSSHILRSTTENQRQKTNCLQLRARPAADFLLITHFRSNARNSNSTDHTKPCIPIKKDIRRCIQKFPDWVDNEIKNNNKHWFRSNIKGYGGKTDYTDSQNSDTTASSGRELYHL
jgi:hypothetical protein